MRTQKSQEGNEEKEKMKKQAIETAKSIREQLGGTIFAFPIRRRWTRQALLCGD